MQLLALLGVLPLLFVSALADVSTDLFYWPLGVSQPSVLARITYDPASSSSRVVSYHPPTDDARDSLIRVGLYTTTPTNPQAMGWKSRLLFLPRG